MSVLGVGLESDGNGGRQINGSARALAIGLLGLSSLAGSTAFVYNTTSGIEDRIRAEMVRVNEDQYKEFRRLHDQIQDLETGLSQARNDPFTGQMAHVLEQTVNASIKELRAEMVERYSNVSARLVRLETMADEDRRAQD